MPKPTTLSGAMTVLLTAVAVATAASPALDPDMFWHLRTGEAILRDGVPEGDIFSYTVPGREWVTQEWLTEVGMWTLWRIGQAPLLIVVFGLIVAAAFVLVIRTTQARPHVAALFMVFGAMMAEPMTGVRTQMISLLGLAIVLFILEGVRWGRFSDRLIWAIPPVVLLWSNLHAGYLVGVVIVIVYAVGERLELRFGEPSTGLSRPAIRLLPAVALLALLAAAVNPNGIRIWVYPIETLGTDVFLRYITEWQSPDFQNPDTWPFLAGLVMAAAAIARSGRSLRWTHGLLVLGTTVAALQSQRHIQLFAVVFVIVITPHAQDLWDRVQQGRFEFPELATSAPLRRIALAAAPIVVISSYTAAIANNEDATREKFPVDAVAAIQASDELREANLFNSYGWGGYLIWEGLPVFIDGRADMYGAEFTELYIQAVTVQPGWREPIEAFDVDVALLESDAQLAVLLREVPEWEVVFEDEQAVVMARNR